MTQQPPRGMGSPGKQSTEQSAARTTLRPRQEHFTPWFSGVKARPGPAKVLVGRSDWPPASVCDTPSQAWHVRGAWGFVD